MTYTSVWNFEVTLKNGIKKTKLDLTPIGQTEMSQENFLKFSIRPLVAVEIKGAQWIEF